MPRSSPPAMAAAPGTGSSPRRYGTVTRPPPARDVRPVGWERATRKGVHEMRRFMPKLTARRVVAGTLIAALAGVPLAASSTAGAAQTTPRCTTGGLEVWLGVGGGGGAAGSITYPME